MAVEGLAEIAANSEEARLSDDAPLVRYLFFAHGCLAARWILFPCLILSMTGSVLVTIQLGGWFVGWSIIVLVANIIMSRGQVGNSKYFLFGLALLFTAFVLLAHTMLTIVLLEPVGKYLVFLVAGVFLIPMAAIACCGGKGSVRHGLYAVWSIIESFFALAVAHGLVYACSDLLAKEDGTVSSDWQATVTLVYINAVLSWIAALVLVVALVQRSRCRGSNIESESESESRSSGQRIQDLSRGSYTTGTGRDVRQIMVDEARDSANSDESETEESAISRLSPSQKVGLVCLTNYGVLCLLVLLGWYTLNYISYPGIYYDSAIPVPPCQGCFCSPSFNNDSVVVTRDVLYGKSYNYRHQEDRDLTLHTYKAQASNNATAPAIIIIHGGAFFFGSNEQATAVNEAMFFAEHGFTVFNIRYRLEATDPALPSYAAVEDAVEDAKAAVRFVVRHAATYGVDIHRIAVWGYSAGAITAASMNLVAGEGKSGNAGYPSNVTTTVGISGTAWPFVLHGCQGASCMAGPQVPWFNVQGDADPVVYPFLAVMTSLFFSSLGAASENNGLAWVAGMKHVQWNEEHRSLMRPHIQAFLVRTLRLEAVNCYTER